MKKTNKIISLLLALGMMMPMAACVVEEDGPENPDVTLMMKIPDLGYGYEWLEALADGYTQKTGTPTHVEVTDVDTAYGTEIQGGSAKYDMYFNRGPANVIVANPIRVGTKTYDCILVDLTDVYTKPNPYDNGKTTILSKLRDGYDYYNEELRDADGDGVKEVHYFSVQYADSIVGIVRNKKVWKSSWITPVTTDELLSLCNTIKTDGYTPFIWSSQASYWSNFWPVWVYQYQGYEDMLRFWEGLPEAGKGENLSAQMWNRKGWQEGLTVMEKLLDNEKGYMDSYSLSVDFTTAQGYFLDGGRNIAMMVNGDWIENEMKKNYSDVDLDMIKVPVVSAIIDVVPDKSIANDAELSALIKAIDEGNTALTGAGYEVTQNDYDRVKTARNTYINPNTNHQVHIPAYSTKIELAKDFLLYMASDEGMMIMSKTSKGFLLPYEYSDAQMEEIKGVAGDFVRSCLEAREGNAVVSSAMYRSRLFTVAGMPVVPRYQLGSAVEIILSSEKTSETYMTASQIFKKNLANVMNGAVAFNQATGLDFTAN